MNTVDIFGIRSGYGLATGKAMRGPSRSHAALLLICTLSSCTSTQRAAVTMDEIAVRYVKLVLAAGVHDPPSVDTFYGPPGWRVEAATQDTSISALEAQTTSLLEALRRTGDGDESRQRFLHRQIAALASRLRILSGHSLAFDEESEQLYGMVAPRVDDHELEPLLDELEALLPGTGSLSRRLEEFGRRTAVTANRLPVVVQMALAACRTQTLMRLKLPSAEHVTVRFVRNQPWAAYARYQGRFETVIEINDSMPRRPDEVLDLMCHEGYPGHHAQYALVESKMVNGLGWSERTVLALYSPAAALAEGAAIVAPELVFTDAERNLFERKTLWPAAGLSPRDADTAWQIRRLTARLSMGATEGARRYLDGGMKHDEALVWLERHAAMPRPAAFLGFVDQFRSYIVGYTEGATRVRRFLEDGQPAERWARFERVLLDPTTPGLLSRPAPREYQSSTLLPRRRTRPEGWQLR